MVTEPARRSARFGWVTLGCLLWFVAVAREVGRPEGLPAFGLVPFLLILLGVGGWSAAVALGAGRTAAVQAWRWLRGGLPRQEVAGPVAHAAVAWLVLVVAAVVVASTAY